MTLFALLLSLFGLTVGPPQIQPKNNTVPPATEIGGMMDPGGYQDPQQEMGGMMDPGG